MADDPRWKLVEHGVTALERVLDPSAEIFHNVKRPVVGRPEREPRQCDVIIVTGPLHRRTVTIVEVQARGQKPKLTDLHGWVEKMREVGAQHLICVAEAGFPSSFHSEVASKYGPTVRLMTLDEWNDPTNAKAVVLPEFNFVDRRVDYGGLRLELDPPDSGSGSVESTAKIFDAGDPAAAFSLSELADDSLYANLGGGLVGPVGRVVEHEVDLSKFESQLWATMGGVRRRVLSGRYIVRVAILGIRTFPLRKLEYATAPTDVGGTLAWLATATVDTPDREYHLQLAYKLTSTGKLQVAPQMTTSDGGGYMHLFFGSPVASDAGDVVRSGLQEVTDGGATTNSAAGTDLPPDGGATDVK